MSDEHENPFEAARVERELEAMRAIARALEPLTKAGQLRVIAIVDHAYGNRQRAEQLLHLATIEAEREEQLLKRGLCVRHQLASCKAEECAGASP